MCGEEEQKGAWGRWGGFRASSDVPGACRARSGLVAPTERAGVRGDQRPKSGMHLEPRSFREQVFFGANAECNVRAALTSDGGGMCEKYCQKSSTVLKSHSFFCRLAQSCLFMVFLSEDLCSQKHHVFSKMCGPSPGSSWMIGVIAAIVKFALRGLYADDSITQELERFLCLFIVIFEVYLCCENSFQCIRDKINLNERCACPA